MGVIMVVNKIDECICSNGVKVQLWKCENGFDIVLMEKGSVKQTVFTADKKQAEKIYGESIVYIEEKLVMGENLWE